MWCTYPDGRVQRGLPHPQVIFHFAFIHALHNSNPHPPFSCCNRRLLRMGFRFISRTSLRFAGERFAEKCSLHVNHIIHLPLYRTPPMLTWYMRILYHNRHMLEYYYLLSKHLDRRIRIRILDNVGNLLITPLVCTSVKFAHVMCCGCIVYKGFGAQKRKVIWRGGAHIGIISFLSIYPPNKVMGLLLSFDNYLLLA